MFRAGASVYLAPVRLDGRMRRGVDVRARAVAIALGCGRLAIGGALWLVPGPALGALGFGTGEARSLALARIAATRDLVLGVRQLRSLDDREALRRASLAVTASDLGDALVFALALRSDPELRTAASRGLAGALPASVAGIWLLRRLGP